jgi:large subunit ribosomal protein L19e
MNLAKKKILASNTLNIGKNRIVFVNSRLDEIKEAITKQDIRDLKEEGAIVVKEIKGKRKKEKRKNKRGPGKIKKKVNRSKQDYVIMTRKLRKYVAEMKKQGILTMDEVKDIRKKIRNKIFRSKAHLKSYIGGLRK